MKARMMVTGRSTSYLFLDTKNAPDDATHCSVELGGAFWVDVEDEGQTIWLHSDSDGTERYLVVPREDFDFDAPFRVWWPVPTPIILMDEDEYKRYEDLG